MRINCPHCGIRDAQEFVYFGDASPKRPDDMAAATAAMFSYVYLRDNPAGNLCEFWYHGSGCREWLVVTRDTRTHVIAVVESAKTRRHGAAA